jgi:hypothetical protein
MLQYNVAFATNPHKTELPADASLLCDVTAVVETRLLRHFLITCLRFQQICHNIKLRIIDKITIVDKVDAVF